MLAFFALSKRLFNVQMSCMMSMVRPSDQKKWKYIISPSEPSVSVGQKTGMSFWVQDKAMSDCGQEDMGAHFIHPVVNQLFVVNLLAQSVDDTAGCPDDACSVLLV